MGTRPRSGPSASTIDDEKCKTSKGTGRRRAPTADRSDCEHDRQCLDGFDKRAHERRCDGWCYRRPIHPLSMHALGLVWDDYLPFVE